MALTGENNSALAPVQVQTEEGDGAEGGLPPTEILGIVEILEKILRLCPFQDQLILHSLNKQVYEDSLRYWRQNAVARLTWCNCLTLTPEQQKSCDGAPHNQNFEEVSSTPLLQLANYPYRCLHLRNWDFQPALAAENVLNSAGFRLSVGPGIHKLQISGARIMKTRLLGDPFFQRFPNLQRLTLTDIVWVRVGWRWNETDTSRHNVTLQNVRALTVSNCGLEMGPMTALLRHFPNLQEFTVKDEKEVNSNQDNCYATVRILKNILNVLQQTKRRQQDSYNLEYLDFFDLHERAFRCCSFNREEHKFQQFPPSQFPLKFFAVDVAVRLTATGACNILSAHQRTMEVLKLFRAPAEEPFWSFGTGVGVTMLAMRELHIWGSIIPHFGFLKSMPNLKYFKLQRSCYEKKHKVRNYLKNKYFMTWDTCYVENTKKLWVKCADTREDGSAIGLNMEYFEVDFEFGKKSVRALSRWMPNLKEMKFIVNDDTVKTVAKRWPNLQALTMLHGSTLNNEAVCEHLVKLKKLRSLTLETACDESTLGDDSVQNGFMKMEKLKVLDIGVSPDMSEQSEALLRGHVVEKLTIRRNYGEHEGPCCDLTAYLEGSLPPQNRNSITLRSRTVVTPGR